MNIKSKISKSLGNIGLFLLFFSFILTAFSVASAQGLDVGVEPLNSTIELSDLDPRIMVVRIINIALSLLGAIAVILVIYAGAIWMLSEGNEDRVAKAKRILKQAVIGLIIILMSWSITYFILNRLVEQAQSLSQEINKTNRPGFSGASAMGACVLESVYPTPNQKEVPRNTSILATFKEEVDITSVCSDSATPCMLNKDAIKIIAEGEADPIDAKLSLSANNKTLIITPLNYLGSEARYTNYEATLTASIKKLLNGESMFSTCASDTYTWNFEVSNKLDLTPPQIIDVFPVPDNAQDSYSLLPAVAAQGVVELLGNPHSYLPAAITSITGSPSVTSSSLDNYKGSFTDFRVSITTSGKAQLFTGTTLLGAADVVENSISFPAYFSFSLSTKPVSGNIWDIKVRPERLASTLTVGPTTYVFADNSNGNNIEINNLKIETLRNIQAKFVNSEEVIVFSNLIHSSKLRFVAKVYGSAGNNIVLQTNDSDNIKITPMAGGIGGGESVVVNDKPDQPRNSTLQITFNEPINPLSISGNSEDLKDWLRVFVSDGGDADDPCSADIDCKSFKCGTDLTCEGDYISGKFLPASNFKAVNFISDNECGMNGCGEKIYCLPPNSKIVVEVGAAPLFSCSNNESCSVFGNYKCQNVSLLGKVCRDDNNINYPLADVTNLKGVADLAGNSLDGNSDGDADGHIGYFIANVPLVSGDDSYKWLFFINDKIMLDSPRILYNLVPYLDEEDVVLNKQISIPFNALIMASTIRTGSETREVIIPGNSKATTVNHKFINLWSQAPQPLGFWTDFNYVDDRGFGQANYNRDGVFDRTDIFINHSDFIESVTYNAQVGSGLRDIYQNCFKPSSGAQCEADEEDSSCCFGSPTDQLNEDGDCVGF